MTDYKRNHQDPLLESVKICKKIQRELVSIQERLDWVIAQFKPKSSESVNEAIERMTK